MRKKVSVLKLIVPLLMLVCACNNEPSSNLIINNSAEIPSYDSVPKG